MDNHVTRLSLTQIAICYKLIAYGVTPLTGKGGARMLIERKPAAVHVKISTDFNML